MKFDKEYSTNWVDEQKFLFDKGIRYSFVKVLDGVTTYKYEKNYELFTALAEFYSNVYSRKINQKNHNNN